MRGKVIRLSRIYRADLRANPTIAFVFGDNMQGIGMGGQAGEMRGEPNAIGLSTKYRPTMDHQAFFSDDDMHSAARVAIDAAFDAIIAWLESGRDVVIPADGLGTGLSELPQRAPKVLSYIEERISALSEP